MPAGCRKVACFRFYTPKGDTFAMTDMTYLTALDTYNNLYTKTGANYDYQRVRWELEYLTLRHETLTDAQTDALITRMMNALTDSALELVGYTPCAGALVGFVHALAAWELLHEELYERILRHLNNFSDYLPEAKEKLAEFKMTWNSVALIQSIRSQLQKLHELFLEDNSPQSLVNLRFTEAAQEMLKAASELTRPNLCNIEFSTAKQNAMKAIRAITDGVDYIPEY